MLVHAISHDRPRRQFSKSWGLSANPLPALLLASLFMRSLTLVPCSLLQNHKEMLAMQAKRRPMPSTTESGSTILLIKQETGNVSFCGGRMTRERKRDEKHSQQGREWRANITFEWVRDLRNSRPTVHRIVSTVTGKFQSTSIGSTTSYSIKVSMLPLWWI